MLARNLFPSPSQAEAHFTIPAISVNSTTVGIIFCPFTVDLIFSSLESFTLTIPEFGSIVQNGKFRASAQ